MRGRSKARRTEPCGLHGTTPPRMPADTLPPPADYLVHQSLLDRWDIRYAAEFKTERRGIVCQDLRVVCAGCSSTRLFRHGRCISSNIHIVSCRLGCQQRRSLCAELNLADHRNPASARLSAGRPIKVDSWIQARSVSGREQLTQTIDQLPGPESQRTMVRTKPTEQPPAMKRPP